MTENLVDLWSADLHADEQFQRRAYTLLSSDELDRAQSFQFQIHRNRYVVRRGILRMLLGRYLEKDPAAISFVYGEKGKPSLRDKSLHFNLSHAEDMSCFAFSKSSPLGIDIERVRPFPDLMRIAASFCSFPELSTLVSLPTKDRPWLFFRYWTRKEALVKANGGGLADPSYGLRRPSVEDTQRACASLENDVLPRWCFSSWEAEGGYVGTLASCFPEARIVQHRFTDFSVKSRRATTFPSRLTR